jgi:hypothetical protein
LAIQTQESIEALKFHEVTGQQRRYGPKSCIPADAKMVGDATLELYASRLSIGPA